MRLTRHYPRSFEALLDLTAKSVGDSSPVVFQAGHFLLVHDPSTGSVSPCILGDPFSTSDSALLDNYGKFPLLTWKLALRLLDNLATGSKHLMIVVNDWQYLPEGVDRSGFYLRQSGELPESYRSLLAEASPGVSLLEPRPVKTGVSTAPFYGEMNLRNRYKRRVSKQVSSGDLPPNAIVEQTATGISCSLPGSYGVREEIYCSGKTGDCTAEIAEMLREANERTGAVYFVNLYPIVCRDFVEQGTERSVELFKVPMRSVLNLGFPSSAVDGERDLIEGCEASLHQF